MLVNCKHLPSIRDALACPVGRGAAEDRPVAAWQSTPAFAPPPIATAYGTLLNHRDALAALGDAVHQPPHKAPPKAPVLYIKPRHCLAGHGSAVEVPAALGIGHFFAERQYGFVYFHGVVQRTIDRLDHIHLFHIGSPA